MKTSQVAREFASPQHSRAGEVNLVVLPSGSAFRAERVLCHRRADRFHLRAFSDVSKVLLIKETANVPFGIEASWIGLYCPDRFRVYVYYIRKHRLATRALPPRQNTHVSGHARLPLPYAVRMPPYPGTCTPFRVRIA